MNERQEIEIMRLELVTEADKMFKRIQRPFNADNIQDLVAELADRIIIVARAGKMKGDARWILDVKKASATEKLAGKKLTATEFKESVSAETVDEARLYETLDRLNAVIVHQLDGLRTLLSTEKINLIESHRQGHTGRT